MTLVFAKDDPADEKDAYQSLRDLTDVIALVQKNYVAEVKVTDLVEGAIKGMLLSLDPHSSYLSDDGYKDLQIETKGEFGGLGVEITVKDSLLTVVAPIEDSPAFRAGVRPGDQIIKIGDEFTKDLSINDAIKKMRGPKGTPITISVHREGEKELLPITVIRDVIKVKSVRYRPLDPGFGYIRLAQFQDGSAEELAEALQSLSKKEKNGKIKGIVLDMRNNPGGLLTQAVKVSDLFLEDGLIVYTDGRLESQKTKYYAHNEGDEPKFPIVVLVNGGSASAAEIVAGALQDSGRALIVGSQTFGKGSVQTVLPMDDGAALRLTTALYYTRNGRSIQAQGITPDITVQQEVANESETKEEQTIREMLKESDLPHALPNPKMKDGVEPQEPKSKKTSSPLPPPSSSIISMDLQQLLKEDSQIAEAYRLLKTWSTTNVKPAAPQAPAQVAAS